jgi:type I site-specific restriction endonuclease
MEITALEPRRQQARPVPRRPQRADRPDHGERFPPLWCGNGEAFDQCQDHRTAGRQGVDLTLALDRKRRIDTAFEIYLGLYQAITGPEERQKLFKEFSKDFFDLIVIDECHRGSAAEDSAWREILTHFCGATQIGLTATPKEREYVSNTEYFGEPVFTYSLKQGISDGFLAPYKVIKVHIDRDVEG